MIKKSIEFMKDLTVGYVSLLILPVMLIAETVKNPHSQEYYKEQLRLRAEKEAKKF